MIDVNDDGSDRLQGRVALVTGAGNGIARRARSRWRATARRSRSTARHRRVRDAMIELGWGRLITTTSHSATGLLGQPIFAAAMGGVISMTRAIAFEHEAAGVTANCLAPGGATRLHAVTRPMFEQLRADELISDAEWDSYVNTPPPEYVAPIVACLCTDEADGATRPHSCSGTAP